MVARQAVPLTPSESLGLAKLPSYQQSSRLTPLAATLVDSTASVANKRLTSRLTPLDATLTKNRGEGSQLRLTSYSFGVTLSPRRPNHYNDSPPSRRATPRTPTKWACYFQFLLSSFNFHLSIEDPDPVGTVDLPADRYYGAQTARSLIHFAIGKDVMPPELIRAFGILKKAAALVNLDLG